jgi:subtilase family serine protease
MKHAALVGATCGLAVAVSASAALGSTPARSALDGSTPAFAKASAPVRASSAKGSVAVRVYLSPRGGLNALKAAVTAVSTPGNAQYHHFVTPAGYRARFEPTPATVATVSAWLKTSGLHVTNVEASRRFIAATGTVAAAEKAFGTQLNVYRHNGKLVRGNASAVSVPASVSGAVMGVTGLSVAAKMRPANNNPPPPAFNNARPCSLTYGQVSAKFQADGVTKLPKFKGATKPYAICGYVPSQFRGAYGVNSTALTGKGATIGIVDAYGSTTMLADANQYSRRHGDAPFAAGQYTQVVPKQSDYTHVNACDPPGWSGEQTLDVEASHGIATGANVRYYGGKSCFNNDLNDAIAKAVDQNLVTEVTNSYGDVDSNETTGDIRATEQVVLQGAMQGISFMYSSGDDGDEIIASGLHQTDYPASDPYVTGVGGTSTAINAQNAIAWQSGWGTHKYTLSTNGKSWTPTSPAFLYGAGGGYSTLFNRPSYQNGVVTGGAPPGRAVPDVALDADVTTGMLVGQTQTFPNGIRYGEARYGGTSLASPLMAGMVALAAQHYKATTGKAARLGFLNPSIYSLTRAKAGAFTDVLPVHTGDGNVRPDYVNGVNPADGIAYSVRTFNQDTSLVVKPGWDDVTGVGTPNAVFLKAFGK